MSQSHKNRTMPQLRSIPLFTSAALNEGTPNWHAYRLSLDRMTYIKSLTTQWRITCSFDTGFNNTDFVKTSYVKFNPLTFIGHGVCKGMMTIDVRGHRCKVCKSSWWQDNSTMLHHDSSSDSCKFGKSAGYVSGEDNFGHYVVTNPKFTCSSSDNATTNLWFGGYK